MSIRTPLIFAAIMCLCVGGCASTRRNVVSSGSSSNSSKATTEIVVGPASRPTLDAKASLRLAEIQPEPKLPATQPVDANAPKPPLEALELYARARDALAGGHQFTAISALERAIKIDPNSAELYRLLSRAYVAGGNNGKAIDALMRATQLEPEDLRAQTIIARLYLQRGKAPEAMDHLRLGLQSKQYAEDEAAAAVADYFLAKSLQQLGYDRAALEQYEKLLDRLSHRALAVRGDPELADWSSRPQSIYSELARLYAKQGEYQKSLDAWRRVASFDLDDLDTRQRIIDMLIALGRGDEALREAAEAIRQTGATSRSLEILRDVAKRVGQENAVYEELRRLQQERPDDRSLLFARVDLLAANGRDAEAQATLEQAARFKFDSEIVRRLIRFYSDRGQSVAAAKLLIEASTAKPDETAALMEPYQSLLQPFWAHSLRPDDVQRIEVAPAAEPVKLYFIAIAADGSREILTREALAKATQLDPIFPPAFRLAVARLGGRTDLDDAARERETRALIDRAELAGAPWLAHELRAMQLLTHKAPKEAIAAFEESFKLRNPSPEPAMYCANALLELGNKAKFEQMIWRLVSDYPTYDPAYQQLIFHHMQPGGSIPAALNALQRWRAANPSSPLGRLFEAQIASQSGQTRDAMRTLGELIAENPQDAVLLRGASDTMLNMKQGPALLQAFEDQLARNPKNVILARQLLLTYQQLNRLSDRIRVVERVHNASAADARTLYLVAQLYSFIDLKDKSHDVLESAYRLDPEDPATNNDLGYTWADAGINLDRAESMTRRAVEAEPDNGSFLDSLGWVFYKRGKFEDARRQLEQSIQLDSAADPVVLDHLGDTLYRLNDAASARVQWSKSLERLVLFPNHPDINTLRPALEQKIQQAQMGQPVNVAPFSIEPQKSSAPVQASKRRDEG